MYRANPTLTNTKFGYAYKKFVEKNITPTIKEINEKMEDERLDKAMVDEKTKEILYNDSTNRSYKYDKQGLKGLLEFSRKLTKEYEEKDIEVIPYISKEVPDELDQNKIDLLIGILL